MAVQLENLRSEIRNFAPEATDEAIVAAVTGCEVAFGKDKWDQMASLIQHPLAIAYFFRGGLSTDMITSVLANDNELIVAAFVALDGEAVTADIKTYLSDRINLFATCNTEHALHAGT